MKIQKLLFLVVAAAPVAAHAQLPTGVTDGMYVTVAEVRAHSIDTFEHFAGPDGGPISRRDFVNTKVPSGVSVEGSEKALLTRLFGLLDANSDGRLTLSEWRKRIDRDLQFADQNDDGRITLKELSNARENMSVGDALGMVF